MDKSRFSFLMLLLCSLFQISQADTGKAIPDKNDPQHHLKTDPFPFDSMPKTITNGPAYQCRAQIARDEPNTTTLGVYAHTTIGLKDGAFEITESQLKASSVQMGVNLEIVRMSNRIQIIARDPRSGRTLAQAISKDGFPIALRIPTTSKEGGLLDISCTPSKRHSDKACADPNMSVGPELPM